MINEYDFSALPIETDEPVKAFGEGVSMGLSVLLNAEVHDYALSSASYYGFKVIRMQNYST